jgi:hypothetical protein
VIIRFHLQQDARADDIGSRLQAQFTDDAGVSSSGKGEKTSMAIRGLVARR